MKKQSISKVEQLNNLKQQVIDLKVANKDKAETIKAMKQELLEYSELRDRFKVLYEENKKLKKAIEIFEEKRVNIDYLLNSSECPTYNFYADDFSDLTQQEYELLKEVLGND